MRTIARIALDQQPQRCCRCSWIGSARTMARGKSTLLTCPQCACSQFDRLECGDG
jgi:hypothetical protein